MENGELEKKNEEKKERERELIMKTRDVWSFNVLKFFFLEKLGLFGLFFFMG